MRFTVLLENGEPKVYLGYPEENNIVYDTRLDWTMLTEGLLEIYLIDTKDYSLRDFDTIRCRIEEEIKKALHKSA